MRPFGHDFFQRQDAIVFMFSVLWPVASHVMNVIDSELERIAQRVKFCNEKRLRVPRVDVFWKNTGFKRFEGLFLVLRTEINDTPFHEQFVVQGKEVGFRQPKTIQTS